MAKTAEYRETIFGSADPIYGLEIQALLAILYYSINKLGNRNATFHIDNGNAFEAVVKNAVTPTSILAKTQLIWHRIYELGPPHGTRGYRAPGILQTPELGK